MKAITIREPWATLMAIGAKQIETRSWPTNYRGPIAIHAAKGMTGADADFLRHYNAKFLDAFNESRIHPITGMPVALDEYFNIYDWNFEFAPATWFLQRTRGCVIATATLDCCGAFDAATHRRVIDRFGENELAFGDFTPGRFGFYLANVVRLPRPIPAKGQLGLWDWEPPVELRGAA